MTEKRIDHPKGLAFVHMREIVTMTDSGVMPLRFEVSTSTGYLATLPACGRDECMAGTVTPCALRYGHTKSAKGANGCDGSASVRNGRCHAWHWPSVERFAGEVLKTYGAKVKPGQVGVPRGSVGLLNFAEIVQ